MIWKKKVSNKLKDYVGIIKIHGRKPFYVSIGEDALSVIICGHVNGRLCSYYFYHDSFYNLKINQTCPANIRTTGNFQNTFLVIMSDNVRTCVCTILTST